MSSTLLLAHTHKHIQSPRARARTHTHTHRHTHTHTHRGSVQQCDTSNIKQSEDTNSALISDSLTNKQPVLQSLAQLLDIILDYNMVSFTTGIYTT